jgi:hypothetical protein
MKLKGKFVLVSTITLLNMVLVVASCQKDENSGIANNNSKATTATVKIDSDCNCIVNPSDTISPVETEMLIFMREEEKLARDVYITMYSIYHIPIFNNISKSEQHHMDQVLCLLQYYNIPDPASADTGVFTNPDLQALYNDLVTQGSISLNEALTVGATIEDKDIFDLEGDIAGTSNEAIITIFERLACASGNHMRSFYTLLTNRGITYVPQYISQEEYDAIISTPHQFCGATTNKAVMDMDGTE